MAPPRAGRRTPSRGRSRRRGRQGRGDSLALAALALLAAAAARAQPVDFENILAAAQGLNCTTLLAHLNASGLASSYAIEQQIIFLMPTNDAWVDGMYPPPQRLVNQTGVGAPDGGYLGATALTLEMGFHSIPLPIPRGNLSFRDGTSVPSLMLERPISQADTGVVVTNLTFRVDNDIVYVGGVPPGGYFNQSRSWTAGASRVYLIDRMMLAPDSGLLSERIMPGLNIVDALANMDTAVVGLFLQLIRGDSLLPGFLGSVDQAVTMLVPTNSAVQELLNRLNLNITQYKGSEAARKLIQSHVLPDRPWHSRLLPPGQTISIPTYVGGDAFVSVSTADVGKDTPVITLTSSGNVVPINVIQADILAGKSVIHIISDVVLLSSLPGAGPPGQGGVLPPPATSGTSPPPASPPLGGGGGGSGVSGGTPIPSDLAPGGQSPPASSSPSDDESSALSGGAIAGIVVGVVGGVAVLAGAAAVLVRRRRWRGGDSSETQRLNKQLSGNKNHRGGDGKASPSGAGGTDSREGGGTPNIGTQSDGGAVASAGDRGGSPTGGGDSSQRATKGPVHVHGFIYGDPFLRTTAIQYTWTDVPTGTTLQGVEVGVNDVELDRLARAPPASSSSSSTSAAAGAPSSSGGAAGGAAAATGAAAAAAAVAAASRVVRLSRADVVKQIRLLRNGLLGRGSSAVVFRCQWPSRFGPNALLAIKVLKDPYQADPSVFESFCYEAAVLATVRHPNVVRMFGYCLELPTACIIMELLPQTLKDRMYRNLDRHAARQQPGGRGVQRSPALLPDDDDSSSTSSSVVPGGGAAGGQGGSGGGNNKAPAPAAPAAGPLSSSSSSQPAAATIVSNPSNPSNPSDTAVGDATAAAAAAVGFGARASSGSGGPGEGAVAATVVELRQAAEAAAREAQQQGAAAGPQHVALEVAAAGGGGLQGEGGGGLRAAATTQGGTEVGTPTRSTATAHTAASGAAAAAAAATAATPQEAAAAAAASGGGRDEAQPPLSTRPSRTDGGNPSVNPTAPHGDAAPHLAVQHNRLSMAQVLKIATDVAAGLAYLHKRPAVVSLPAHPTVMLEDSASTAGRLPTVPETRQLRGSLEVPDDDDDEEELEEVKSIARIVHRDLKPSNILLGTSGTAKISDFGLARWHNNTTVHTGKLGVGTLRYMAPELLLGHTSQTAGFDSPPMTNRVDMYSLGMLMWEMASACMPWNGMNDTQIIAAVIARQRPNMDGPPSEVAEPSPDLADAEGLLALMRGVGATATSLAGLPAGLAQFPELQALINACWQQNDKKRPTAKAVHRALLALLGRFVTGTTPPPSGGLLSSSATAAAASSSSSVGLGSAAAP